MGGMMKFGAVAAGLGTAVSGVAIAGDSLKKAMDFESQMSTIQALTGATDEQTKAMQQLALQQGALTKYSALEAAQGIEELLKAGMSTAQVQAGGLNAALNLATAGGLGLAESAEIMSNSLNGFKKDGLQAAQAADILAGTANASATDVHDLRYSLAAVGSVADGVGMSFKDTNTALGLFANNMLKGADAGTSLKTFLSNLVPATDKAYGMFEDFNLLTVNTTDALAFMSKKGIKSTGTSVQAVTKDIEKYVAAQTGLKVGTSKAAKETKKFLTASNLIHSAFYDNKGQIKDLAQVADLLKNRFGKLTNEQRHYYLHQIFGSDAIRAGNILFKEGAAGVKKFQQEMANVTALQVATKKMDNAAGAVEQFQGAIETLQISALLPTMPILKKLAQAASDFVVKYTPQITAAVERTVNTAKNYLKSHFINNPAFNRLPDIQSKIAFIFDDVMATFNKWWDNGGSAAFEETGRKIGNTIGKALKASGPLLQAATKVGVDIGAAVVTGVLKEIGNNPVASSLLLGGAGANLGSRFGPWGAVIGGAGGAVVGIGASEFAQAASAAQERSAAYAEKAKSGGKISYQGVATPGYNGPTGIQRFNAWKEDGKHSGGLNNVPFDGYKAELHKGERVLTRGQADEYRRNEGRGDVNITINATIREESDIEKLAGVLARRLAM